MSLYFYFRRVLNFDLLSSPPPPPPWGPKLLDLSLPSSPPPPPKKKIKSPGYGPAIVIRKDKKLSDTSMKLSRMGHIVHFLFLNGFKVWFNTFQVLSGRCPLVTEDMTTTLWSCLAEYHTTGSCTIYHLVILFCNRVNDTSLKLPFICWAYDMGASTANLKFLFWFVQESNLQISSHGAIALPLG